MEPKNSTESCSSELSIQRMSYEDPENYNIYRNKTFGDKILGEMRELGRKLRILFVPNITEHKDPHFIYFMTIIQICIYISQAVKVYDLTIPKNEVDFGRLSRPLFYQDPWRILTIVLLHRNIIHILSNMIVQIITGIYVEKKYGTFRVFIIYVISAVYASLTFICFETKWVIGCSGAVYGLIGLYIADNLINRETTGCFTINIMMSIGFFIGLLFEEFLATGVATLAHLGGLVSGLCISVLIIPNIKRERFECYIPYISFGVLCIQSILITVMLVILSR